jgi:nucleoid-associated protein YgaU
MSKDVIIAGAIAVGCIALIAVAFIAPKSKSTDGEPTKTETTTTITDSSGLGPNPTGTFDPSGFPPVSTTGISTLPISGTGSAFPPVASFNNNPFPNTGTGSALPPVSSPFPPAVVEQPKPVAPAASEAKTHIVANGELLGDIALKYLGSAKLWKKIVEANPGLDPKNLKVGQKLVIPAVEGKTDTAAPVVATGGERTYTVKSGDTLYVIAKRELGSASRWKEIEKLNNLSTNDLKIGQVIKLPAAPGSSTGTTTPGTSTTPDAAAPTGGKTHSVAKGETLADISKKYYGTTKNWKKIVEANPGVSPENLKVGQKLVIPEVAGSTTAPVAGTTADAAPAAAGEYTIKVGDTLGSIAAKELGSKNKWKELQSANPGLDPRNLRAGQKIKIPGKKADAAVEAAPNHSPLAPAPAPAPAPGFGNQGGFAPAPAPAGLGGAPGAQAQPANGGFPADPNFNSPYGGNGFGQPAQPFNQNGNGFSQTGGAPAPAPEPFPGAAPFPGATNGAQPIR